MHMVALQLAPVLAAEKSKVPFYIAGGALVVWALVVSLLLGMRKQDFPGSLQGQRLVSAVTAVLVIAAMGAAVLTAGGTAKSSAATPAPPAPTSSQASSPAPAQTSASTSTAPAATAPSTTPATTPAPAPATTAAPAPATTKPTTLKLAADAGGGLLFNTKALRATPGTVTIVFTNRSTVEHNLTVAQGSTVLAATPRFTGASKSITVTLRPGTYMFYCSVPGHRQAGMEGTLTVG
jgi:plastocyanin